MKYVSPFYRNEKVEAEDIMSVSIKPVKKVVKVMENGVEVEKEVIKTETVTVPGETIVQTETITNTETVTRLVDKITNIQTKW